MTLLSSSLSSSSLSAKSSGSKTNSGRVYLLQGSPFEEMARDQQCPYNQILEMPVEYAIYIERKSYHWFLLVRCTKFRHTETEQFVTLEITTPDLRSFCPVMDVLQDDKGKESVGDYEGTFLDLCIMADRMVDGMGKYSLFNNNCQHFCNNILNQLKMRTFPTTVGPKTTLDETPKFDRFDYLVDHMGLRIASVFARVINESVRAPTSKDTERSLKLFEL